MKINNTKKTFHNFLMVVNVMTCVREFVCVCATEQIRTTTFLSLYIIMIRERRQNIFWTMIEILFFLSFHHGTIFISETHKGKWIWTIDGWMCVCVCECVCARRQLSLPLSQQGCVYVEIFRRSFFLAALVISRIYFLIYIAIRKLIFQEKL